MHRLEELQVLPHVDGSHVGLERGVVVADLAGGLLHQAVSLGLGGGVARSLGHWRFGFLKAFKARIELFGVELG